MARHVQRKVPAVLGAIGIAIAPVVATAAPVGSATVFNSVESQYVTTLSAFAAPIQGAANKLFWALALLSLAWTFGMMALRKAELGEIFGELIKFIMTTGFMFWLLLNGPAFALDIWQGLQNLGLVAAAGTNANPGSLIGAGLTMFAQIWTQTKWGISTFAPSLVAVLLGIGIVLAFLWIALNILLIHISAYFVGYIGVFVLGFGGSKWTSEFAINYYKAMLATGMQLLGMVTLVTVGMKMVQNFLDTAMASTNFLDQPFQIMNVLIAVIIMAYLARQIPAALSALVTGPLTGGAHTAGGVTMLGAAAAGAAAGVAAAKVALGLAAGGAGAGAAIKAASQMAGAAGEAAASEPSGGDVSAAVKAAAAGIDSMAPPPGGGSGGPSGGPAAGGEAAASAGSGGGDAKPGSSSVAGQLAGG